MIFVTGDTHGKFDAKKLNPIYFPEGTQLSKSDYVIVTGDFGFIWDGSLEDIQWLKWFEDMPFTTLFVDGNHENFDLLNGYEVEMWNGGMVHRINDSVIHLMRGQIFYLENFSFFTFGGAKSLDIEHRQKHSSWWPQELPNDFEYAEGLINLKKHNWTVDFIITHTCSSRTQNLIKDIYGKDKLSDRLNEYFDEIEEKVSYNHWYFGHNHIDEAISPKQTIVYNKVIQITWK